MVRFCTGRSSSGRSPVESQPLRRWVTNDGEESVGPTEIWKWASLQNGGDEYHVIIKPLAAGIQITGPIGSQDFSTQPKFYVASTQ